ncbi:MAG TPA: phage tail protein [Steroidobacteraceae bacterium]|jgi:phage tail-like protein|nr:phage tail protein [Steroidobacteraceae bacterium]
MSRAAAQGYRFETEAQWNACLFHSADRGSRVARAGLSAQAPFAYEAHIIAAPGARAPAMTPAGEILWHDAANLLRALPTDDVAERTTASWAITHAPRMVATHDAIWVAGATHGTLECFDLRSLSRRRVLEVEGATVLDLAAMSRNTLLVLVRRMDANGDVQHELVHVDCGGSLAAIARLDPCMQPAQLACLPVPDSGPVRVVLLDTDRTRLYGLEIEMARARHDAQTLDTATAQWTLQLGALRRCFKADVLASDGRARIFLAGAEGREFGAVPYVLTLDRDATLIDALQMKSAATGLAGGRGHLVVSHAEGISIHSRATIAGDVAAVLSELVTPLLRAPESDAEIKWQRADLWATLPVGTTLELRYGWTKDEETRRDALRMTRDSKLSQSQRVARLKDLIDWSAPVTFAGSAPSGARSANNATPYSFPLLDARVAQLWLNVTLRAAPRAALPTLTRMTVSYAGSPLLQQLPAVYRRTAVLPGDFLGALVGTLEATTQDLDRRIGGLGDLVHPDTAPVAWLDEIAEWLGLPWDDALEPEQKRALVRAAAQLASQRGTRAGLATLLGSLFPGMPPRFRITDVDVDFGFVALGGGTCCGSALPAVLAGLPRTATVLSRKTILGQARLPCEGYEPSATARLSGNLRVDLAVSAAERRRSERWLARLVEAMVPANVRVELRWHLPRGTSFDGLGELPATPLAHLGSDAITGVARLPDSGAGNVLS